MRLTGATWIACVLTAAAAWAQGPPDVQAPPLQRPLAQGQTADLRPAEIQRLLDGMAVVDAQEALSLSDKQYAEFIIRLRALQQTRRRHQQQRAQIMMDLQRLTNPRAAERGDEATVKQRLVDLRELEARATVELRKAYTGIDDVLDVRQQARFRVFEEQLERRRFELMQRMRQNLQNRQQQRQQ
jgi:hypothetical protein